MVETTDVYIGLDLGTSVIKGIVVDRGGHILSQSFQEVSLSLPQTGWAEQDPSKWWNSTLEILNQLVPDRYGEIQGIGISGQMHGLITYDKKKRVVRPAILWLDRRSYDEVKIIHDAVGEERVYAITGNPMFTGFLLPSLLWIKQDEPELYRRISTVSSPKDYLAFQLTGNLRSEPTDALSTGAYDYKNDQWSKDMIESVGIDPSLFPEIQPTCLPYGHVTKAAAKETGINEGVPVYGASDQSMAALGMGLIEEGQAAIAISTGGQFLVIAKREVIDSRHRLHTLNHAIPNLGLYMAATLSAGLSLRWFKNEVIQVTRVPYEEFLKGTESVSPGSDGLFFLPYLVGERTPYFNPSLRAGFIGLSDSHSQQHLARAIMEGVAFSLRDCLEVFNQLGIPIDKIILSGGGAKNALWRQIITDVVNVPTETINIEDHSPFGAAILARFAQEGFNQLPGFYAQVIKRRDLQEPNQQKADIYNHLYNQYKEHGKYMNEIYR